MTTLRIASLVEGARKRAGATGSLRRTLTFLVLITLLLAGITACEDPPAIPGLHYWSTVQEVRDSINAHRQYSPGKQRVDLTASGFVPAFPFDGIRDNPTGNPLSFGKVVSLDDPRYTATLYLFPGKGDLDYLNRPLIVSDGLDPYNLRGASTLYSEAQYRRLLSLNGSDPRGLGYDIYLLDFSQGAGDILINAALELAFVGWMQERIAPTTSLFIGGPSMSGIVARVAMLYALPQNNTTGNYLAQHVTGYLSIDSPHQGAGLDPSLPTALREFYDELMRDGRPSREIAAQHALYGWQRSATPATYQMLYGHQYLNEASPQVAAHDLFYGFLNELGGYNRRMPRAAIAYSNFFAPHGGIQAQNERRTVGAFDVFVDDGVPGEIKFRRDLYAGGSLAAGATDAERAGFHEFAPGSVSGDFYWSPYRNSPAQYIQANDVSGNGEVFKGTHIPIYSALDLAPSFDVLNPPTTDEVELAGFSNFDAVYYMKNEFNGYRDSRTVNDKRYEHIVFDDQLMGVIAEALAFLEEKSTPPVAVGDRYDVNKDRALHVGAPGVLANDITVNGNPTVYALDKYPHAPDAEHLSELVQPGAGSWLLNYRSIAGGGVGKSFAMATIDGAKRLLYLSTSRQWSGWHIVESSVPEFNERRDLTQQLNAPLPSADTPLAVTMVNGEPRLYYLSAGENRVQELGWFAGQWHYRDVSADAGAPPAIPGSALAALSITNGNPRVYYLAEAGDGLHIHELAWRSLTNVWYHRDVTLDTGAPSIMTGSPLAVATSDLAARIYYIGGDQHIYELGWFSDGWRWNDVTALGAGALADNGRLTAVTINGTPRVYYSRDNDIHELADSGGKWIATNLTGLTNAAKAFGPALAGTNVNGEPHVYYMAAGEKLGGNRFQDIHELVGQGGAWRHYDITTPLHDNSQFRWQVDTSATMTLVAAATDNPSYQAILGRDVAHGKLTLYADGSFVYTPKAGFVGRDSFTYRASTGFVASAEVTVELDVTDECAPVPGNLVANFCFARGRAQWRFRTTGQGTFITTTDNPYAGKASAQVTINVPGDNLQLHQSGITLQPNTVYELAFAAYSSDGRDMSLWLHDHRGNNSDYGLQGSRVDLTTHWRWYSITFTTPDRPGMNNARLRFWFTHFAQAGTVYHIDRVLLRPVDNS